MRLGGQLGYRVLRSISPSGNQSHCTGAAYRQRGKLETLFGNQIRSELRGKSVIDFGCGSGAEAVEIARCGASRVIGIDINEERLRQAAELAEHAGFSSICLFCSQTREKADIILSLDAFEHFQDPAEILHKMASLVRPGGCVLASFGPTWYHPYGGHFFSVFPWAHLIFSEEALIRWRADFKTDGATRFSEVEGGLNQMTIARFGRIVRESEFRMAAFEAVPIRAARFFHNWMTREFLTSIVRCKLVLKQAPPAS